MSQKPKIKTIKCRVCHKKFKVKSTDFDREIQTCVLTDCDLKVRIEEINSVAVFPCKAAVNDSIVVTIEDPIVIKVDKHGVESRTLS